MFELHRHIDTLEIHIAMCKPMFYCAYVVNCSIVLPELKSATQEAMP